MKLSNNQILVLLTLAVVVFGFYWVAVRPQIIKKECYQKSLEDMREKKIENPSMDTADYLRGIDILTSVCLKKRGL